MLSMLLGAIAGVSVGLYLHSRFSSQRDYVIPTVFGILFGAIIGLAGAVGIGEFIDVVRYEASSVDLAAMRTVDGMTGAFVFGSGDVSSTSRYRVYLKHEDGSISPHSVPVASNVRIRELDSLKDRGVLITWSDELDRSSWLRYFAIFAEPRLSYEMQVPLGSVRHTFSAN